MPREEKSTYISSVGEKHIPSWREGCFVEKYNRFAVWGKRLQIDVIWTARRKMVLWVTMSLYCLGLWATWSSATCQRVDHVAQVDREAKGTEKPQAARDSQDVPVTAQVMLPWMTGGAFPSRAVRPARHAVQTHSGCCLRLVHGLGHPQRVSYQEPPYAYGGNVFPPTDTAPSHWTLAWIRGHVWLRLSSSLTSNL